jgi:malate synthase
MPQRLKFHVRLSGNGFTTVTNELFRNMLSEEMQVVRLELGTERFDGGRFEEAARLMERITTQDELIDFLTLPGYALLA